MQKTTTRRLSFTLLLSLAAHGLLLVSWPGTPEIPEAGGQAMTLSLVVLASRQVQPAGTPDRQTGEQAVTQLPPRPVTQAPRKNTPRAVPRVTSQPATRDLTAETAAPLAQQPPTTVAQSSPDRPAEAGGAASQARRERLEQVLRKAFNAHFYYPRLAIRRGWQGKVQLGLHIESNGRLSRVQVLRSSGYGLLDNAALHSLGKVEMLEESVALLQGHGLDLVLPVEYRLL